MASPLPLLESNSVDPHELSTLRQRGSEGAIEMRLADGPAVLADEVGNSGPDLFSADRP